MKLIIEKPRIVQDDETKVSLNISFDLGEQPIELWYKFPNSYREFVNEELADAYIVGLLIYAMQRGLDIETELLVSDILLEKITKYLIPFLCKINPVLKPIHIKAKPSTCIFSGKHNGTGISCGVDSLSTVIYHGVEEEIVSCKIDTLTLLNTGYYGLNEDNQEKYKSYIGRSSDFCKEFGYELFTLDTNLRTITNYDFVAAATYLTCSTLLLFQKYFRNYYFASGYPVYNFRAYYDHCAYYDMYLLDCISTRSLCFFSSCCTMTRIDKTKLIAQHPAIYRYMYVCLGGDPSHNCSRCEKCQRTMLALDAIGRSDLIEVAFDIKKFRKNRVAHYAYMLRHQSSPFYKEIKDEMKRNGKSVPLRSYFYILPTHVELLQFRRYISNSRFGNYLRPLYNRFMKC